MSKGNNVSDSDKVTAQDEKVELPSPSQIKLQETIQTIAAVEKEAGLLNAEIKQAEEAFTAKQAQMNNLRQQHITLNTLKKVLEGIVAEEQNG